MNNPFINYKTFSKLLTVQEILYWTVNCFNSVNIWYGHGSDNSFDEAIKLILPSLNLPLDINYNIYLDKHLNSDEKNLIFKLVIRRIKERIPVAYLTNKSWFCNHEFYVDKRVLIPRSPIGELIDNYFYGIIRQQPKHILDMCTGSGCIAISCAYIFKESKLDAVDISSDAIAVAKYNIEKHNLAHRITLINSDLFFNVPRIRYDLIVANPPYVKENDISNLPKEYYYEPKLGLVSGSDGLKLVRRILACAPNYLAKDGILICEVGNNMTFLMKHYKNVPFIWFEFANGGDGVFMLNKTQLISAYKYFT